VPVVPGTFYAIGSNYRDHVEKMAQARGREPIWYQRPRVGYRANSALIADGDDIVKPADSSDEFQYEAELVAERLDRDGLGAVANQPRPELRP